MTSDLVTMTERAQPNNALVPTVARSGQMIGRSNMNSPTTPRSLEASRPDAARPAASLARGGRGCSTARDLLGCRRDGPNKSINVARRAVRERVSLRWCV